LKSFNIAHDLKYRIPFIKEALATAEKLHAFSSVLGVPGLDEGQ